MATLLRKRLGDDGDKCHYQEKVNSWLSKALLSGVPPIFITSSTRVNEGWRKKSTRLSNEEGETV